MQTQHNSAKRSRGVGTLSRPISRVGALACLAFLAALLLAWSMHSIPLQAQTLVVTVTATVSPTSPLSGTSTANATVRVLPTKSPIGALPTVPTLKAPGMAAPTLAATIPPPSPKPIVKPIAPTPTPRPTASSTPTATAARPGSTIPDVTVTPQARPTYRADADKVIYLTFDDGPSEWTVPIMEVLAEYDARATFFVLGRQAAAAPETIQALYDAGHAIANHTWKHVDLVTVSRSYFEAEISDTAEAIGTEYESLCLRPPYGSRSQSTYSYAEEMGYEVALWSIDTGDWRLPGARAIAQEVLDRLHNRAVILMHDGGGDRSQTLAALHILLPRLQDMGYEMRAVCREDPMPQVGDYVVGIPSELEMNVPTAEPLPEAIAEYPATVETVEAGLIGDSMGYAPTPHPDATQTPETPVGESGAITFPQDSATVRGRVMVQGFVNAEAQGQGAVESWRLNILEADGSAELASGEPNNRIGALGVWDTRTVSNGEHALQLEITYADGSIEQKIVGVVVRNAEE